MPEYFISPAGSDQNSGTSEAQAWKSLDTSTRLKPGDVLTALPGTIVGTFNPPSGTAAAPITFRAKDPGTVTVDGSVRIDGLPWSRITNGFQTPFSRLAFNVFQRDFETAGKLANFNNRDWNQYESNPQLDLHGTPAEFKWVGGQLRLNAIPSTPSAEPLFAAITEIALDLNDRSHVIVENINTRGHKHAVGTRNGAGIHLIGCRFTFCGSTGVWLVGLADSEMIGCTVQGAGSWGGHYEDLVDVRPAGKLRIVDCNLSYGGHSGIIMLDGTPDGKINLTRLHFHHMGGSLLTLKRSVDNLLVEDCWFADAAKSTAVEAHKVPHAGVQLSGKGHVFRNVVFRDNGKDILASSDGNADSNPVCSDNLFDHCTFSGSEAGAVEGQEYAPAGRLERNTWKDCVIRGDVALFYAGAGDHRSNHLIHCEVVGSTNRGVLLADCSSNPLPNTGSTLTAPPVPAGGSGGGSGGGGTGGGGTPLKPRLDRLRPASGAPGTKVTAEGSGFGVNPAVIYSNADGGKRLENLGGSDTAVSWTMPADVVTGIVSVRRVDTTPTQLSNPLTFTVEGGGTANKPPVANPGGPYTGVVGQPVQFDGSGSSDPDGTITLYVWTFGDGVMNPSGPKPTRTYTAPGRYTVTLTVTDNQGAMHTAQTAATITAAPPPPPGALQVALTATSWPKGATFGGTVVADAPLPPGSTIRVIATLPPPDGRTAEATWTAPGMVPPPPPTGDPDAAEKAEAIRLINVERANVGTAAMRAMADPVGEELEMSALRGENTSPVAGLRAAVAVSKPLANRAELARAAQDFAADLHARNVLSHTGADGSDPGTRMRRAGWSGNTWGEVAGRGFSNAASMVVGWMNSPGHRAILLDPVMKEIGMGFVREGGYWVGDLTG